MRYFKALDVEGCSIGGQGFPWPLPHGKRPGKWLPPIKGDLVTCGNGYHVCTIDQVLDWLGPQIWEVEVRGDVVDAGDKTVARSARIVAPTHWDDRTARLFACDCVARALRRERKAGREPNKQNWEALRVARLYAKGKVTKQDLAATFAATEAATATAWDAARATWPAARAAARATWPAAGDAGYATGATWYPTGATWNATQAADWVTWVAAKAAGAAAGDAGYASKIAALAATEAVWTVWAAAKTAGRTASAATEFAAWKAERRWQALRLLEYLDGERGRPGEVTP